ncbi:MAG: 4Fe-4S dicluster domain-containing protein, partial [Christensenellaceae bacterium]|nr:4Fe-4S dicluster domain-containing protein [Christensenellaceae bacterium]
CGYCLPCPAEINIPTAARMSLLLRRAPSAKFLEPAMQEEMNKIENCIGCGNCTSHCPYSLNTPELLRKNLEDYRNVLAKKVSVD